MAQSSPLKPTTILIVEDQAIVRLELAAQLTDAGYRVLEAQDADEAIRLLDDHAEIEILLTDRTMPGSMDGVRLAHHVRDRWPPVKIIVTSGRLGTRADIPAGSAFLPKPYAPESLLTVLGTTC